MNPRTLLCAAFILLSASGMATHASENQKPFTPNAQALNHEEVLYADASRSARPGSGAHRRNNQAQEEAATSTGRRTVKARPGSGARSRARASNERQITAENTSRKARPGRARGSKTPVQDEQVAKN